MRLITLRALITCLAVLVFINARLLSVSSMADDRAAITQFAFTGRKSVDVMQLSPPEKLAELSATLKKAMASNREWFLQVVQSNPPGEPLAYDERMGLTEDEYATYLKLATQMEVKKVGTSWIEMTEIGDGRYRIRAPEELAPLDALEIDMNTSRITSSIGEISSVKNVDAPPATPFGAWQGFQWQANDPGDSSGLSQLRFYLGTRKEDGRALMVYDRTTVRDGRKGRQMVVLYFEI